MKTIMSQNRETLPSQAELDRMVQQGRRERALAFRATLRAIGSKLTGDANTAGEPKEAAVLPAGKTGLGTA